MPIRLLLTQSHQEHRGGDCGAGRVGRGWDAKKDSIRMHHLRMCHAHHGSRTPQMQAGGLHVVQVILRFLLPGLALVFQADSWSKKRESRLWGCFITKAF